MTNQPPDSRERERALAVDQSLIVRAPAGSGKTDLLTRRFLKLLSVVDQPEEILAITFTRAATAEMRARVLGDLEKAQRNGPEQDAERAELARAALKNSQTRGWRLLEQPHRLNIETIDSLCLRIAQSQPLLARLGGRLAPTEHADPLYALAARRAIGRMGSSGPEMDAALKHLLQLRDSSLPNCEALIAGMLKQRDQWVKAFPLSGSMSEDEWSDVRLHLEKPFRNAVKQAHAKVYGLLTREPLLAKELMYLTQYACGNGFEELRPIAGVHALPSPEESTTDHWRAITHLLLTDEGEWRKQVNKGQGFPKENKEEKARMLKLLAHLQQIVGLREALCAARDLPEPGYDENQWRTLRHIFTVLRLAVAELRVLFAERNEVDFTELNLAAREVLGSADVDKMLSFSGNIRHLLVDEFQDTSRSQHDLLTLLVRAWEHGEGRTAFLVGDPMQSIYLFRQAEVELFEQVRCQGLVSANNKVEFESQDLTANFRSHAGLTEKWNEMFPLIFGSVEGPAHVKYSDTMAMNPTPPGESVLVIPQILGSETQKATPEEKRNAREAEAEQVVSIIQKHLERIKQAECDGSEYRVAVLARNRNHLARIVSLLRERAIPFRAVDLETLGERQELIDLMSLARALLHPMDRVAWLSVLRAPWCGLTLADLHALTGADDPAYKNAPVLELIDSRKNTLSADGAARLTRTAAILSQALAARYSATSFSQWLERVWCSLGGPQCVDAAGYENAQTFFALLDDVTPGGMECLTEDFEAELARLYAPPDPRVSERAGVQLMTIHKAKGLGFDVVIVPGLERGTRRDDPPLIASLERLNERESEILVAPIGHKGGGKHPTYAWVERQRAARGAEELKRLFYVACTRARQSLYLLGSAEAVQAGKSESDAAPRVRPPKAGTLLATAWPALRKNFEDAYQTQRRRHTENVVPFPSQSAAPVEPQALDIAAGADAGTESIMGADATPSARIVLRRLPANFDPFPHADNPKFAVRAPIAREPEIQRPEGSRDARQRGSVVHALIEQASRGASMNQLQSSARALLRSLAYSGKSLEAMSSEVLREVANCIHSPDGAWILGAHAQAWSEASWTGWREGALKTLRADRVFVAGPEPRAPGASHLWIIDYKTSAPAGDADFFTHQRAIYLPQLESYAWAFDAAQGIHLPVRFGLYYPRMARLDWWAAEEQPPMRSPRSD